jgi:ribosomal protein S18 acetylase RimI-like enzyme
MDNNFEIKELILVDENIAGAITDLMIQLDPKTESVEVETIKKIIESPDNYLFVVADKEKIVGMLTLISYNTPSGSRGYIEDVVVDITYRGKGLGKLLLNHAIEYSRNLQLEYIGLTSRSDREAANYLYQSLGFEKRDTNVYRYHL